ncbi:MAG: phage tail tape measure protein, partial [Candidatus Peribacteraceae bacterium]|nr:phage tail tape measure protein [Candidatus Peribacteraceae bacterium]
ILSNQVAKGTAETERFSEASFKFAKITKTTATDAVDLLSSALNSYGKEAIEAEAVSAKLFKIIELGRIRSADIANSLGRVTVIAAQLGIELEEVGALMTIITNKGVKATESMTLLRGVMQKLLKPTEDMKELFIEWGVTSGESAIATFGLVGVLNKLEEATRGSASELATLFGRIRATMGITAVLADLEKFNSALIQIRDTSAESYAEAAALQFQTSGEKLSRELNKLKNELAQTLGADVVDDLIFYNENILSITDTVTVLIDQFIKLSITIGTIWTGKKIALAVSYLAAIRSHVLTLQLYRAGALSAAQATQALAVAQAAISLGVTIVVYAAVTAFIAYRKSVKESEEAIKRLDDAYNQYISNQTSGIEKQRTSYEKAIESFRLATQGALQQNAKMTAESNKMITILEERIETEEEWIKEHQKLVERDVKITVDNYTKMYDILIKESENYTKQILKLKKERDDIREDFEDIIESATREKLSPKEDLQRLKDQFTQAQKNSDQFIGSFEDKNKLIEREKDLRVEIFELEKEQIKVRRDEAARIRAEQIKLFNRSTGLKVSTRKGPISDIVPASLVDEFIRDITTIQARAEDVFDAEINKQIEFQSKALELAQEVKDEYVEIAVLINQMMEQLGKPAIKELGATDTLLKNLQETIAQDGTLTLDSGDLATTVEKFIATFNIVEPINKMVETLTLHQSALEENTKALLREINAQTALLSAEKTRGQTLEAQLNDQLLVVKTTLSDFANTARDVKQSVDVITGIGFGGVSAVTEDPQLRSFINTLNTYGDVTRLNTEEQIAYAESLKLLADQTTIVADSLEEKLVSEELITRFSEASELINEQIRQSIEASQAVIESKAKVPELEARVNELTIVFDNITKNATNFGTEISKYSSRIKQLNEVEMTALSNIITRFGASIAAVDAMIRQLGLNRAAGFANGGSVWGTDTVPARLTPGEFVMNQKASRKFYGVLSAMNSGSASSGGDYSTNVGDLTVNVQGGDTTRQSVNNIMSGIRREIHRGKLAGI